MAVTRRGDVTFRHAATVTPPKLRLVAEIGERRAEIGCGVVGPAGGGEAQFGMGIIATRETCPQIMTTLLDHRLRSAFSENIFKTCPSAVAVPI